MMKGVAGRITEWVRPQVPEASDGILTSAGISEGFAGAGAGTKVLIFAGFAAIVAGALAAGAVEYLTEGVERDQQMAELTRPDALAAHAEAEHGIIAASLATPLRDALAVVTAFAAGAVLPWLALIF